MGIQFQRFSAVYKSALIALTLTFSSLSFATSPVFNPPSENIPGPLQPWIDWVLDEQGDEACPYTYNQRSQNCVWPSKLSLDLNNSGGSFSQQWHIFGKESTVQLPGDQNHWPLNVSINDQPLVVQDIGGVPHVILQKGVHTIKGQFSWGELPKSLGMTPKLGLLDLSIYNKSISYPKFNQQNVLWLSQTENTKSTDDNQLDLQVFRRIKDAHPIRIETLIKIRVSGKQRNIELSPVMLDNFIPLHVNSQLPARMERGKLTVQLRPGEWDIIVSSITTENLDAFILPVSKAPWPQEEVWVFDADNTMRQVELSGVNSIDPSQTGLSKEWLPLPAYLIKPEQSLQLKTIARGKNNKSNEKLSLTRHMWLDTDGQGYTIKDQLIGTTELTRLNVTDDIELGNVTIGKEAQLITALDNNKEVGVEIRSNSINLSAESRYEKSRTIIPANGWKTHLQSVSTKINLPPGWRLLFASGTDNLPNSWIKQWTLLDIFIVLVIAAVCTKLFNLLWGSVSLLTLVLTWHEASSPTYLWLFILIVFALVKYIPKSKFTTLSSVTFVLLLLALSLNLFNYTIDTVRYSFFPQLENSISTQSSHVRSVAQEPRLERDLEQVSENRSRRLESKVLMGDVAEKMDGTLSSAQSGSQRSGFKKQRNLQSLDPNNKIQTGPGLPTWSNYNAIRLNWTGPIKPDQVGKLVLIPPLLTSVLRILGIVLLLILASRFIVSFIHIKGTTLSLPKPLGRLYGLPSFLIASLLCGMLSIADTPTAYAKQAQVLNGSENSSIVPRQDILNELKRRLERDKENSAPDCLPYCANIESMNISISDDVMTLRLRAHALHDTAIPLPGSTKTWLPESIVVNSEINPQLQRDQNSQLWVLIPKGLNTVVLRGKIPVGNNLLLPLPLKPHRVSTNINTQFWSIDGINKNGKPSQQLQLTRVTNSVGNNVENTDNWDARTLPAFVMVDRYFELGLTWRVVTTISRVSDQGVPINVDVNVLANEKPLSEQMVVKNGQVSVKLDANQNTLQWSSSIPISGQIALIADKQRSYLETWRFNPNAIWHWQAEGIPVNYQQQFNNTAIQVWRPWPSEKLTLNVSRPQGVSGQAVTVQNSNLDISIGKRAEEFKFSFTAISSRGTQHEISLPSNADIQKLSIDNVNQSIQKNNNNLMLTLKPGKQVVTLNWRADGSISRNYVSPAIDLKLNNVNANIKIKVPQDRWLLWTYGPTIGPAVLFWGVVLTLFLLAFILGQAKVTSLKTYEWALLALGLSQTHPLLILVLIGWLVFIKVKPSFNTALFSVRKFNFIQVSFVGLTVLALLILCGSVANGLLGNPSMMVKGNSSYAYLLQWYQDRSSSLLPQAGFFSLPIWVYRMLMLAWALWLAISVVRWLQNAWAAFSSDGLWRKSVKKDKAVKLDQDTDKNEEK